MEFPEAKIFVMQFLELIKDFETQKSGLKFFLEYFKELDDGASELYIKNSFGNGIKVMTVHKSKGLEFPVVIVPYLRLSYESVKNPYFDDSGDKIKLLNITKKLSRFSLKARKIYDEEKLNSLLGELNVLYVSMTRSKYEFYGIVPPKVKQSNNLVSQLFAGTDFSFGCKQKYITDHDMNENLIFDSFVLPLYKYMDKYLITSNKRIVPDITKARRQGTIIHYALSKIIKVKDTDINDIIKKAVDLSKKKFPFEDVSFVTAKLEKLFSSNDILEMFLYEDDKVFNEKEIVNACGKSFIIDRLILDDDKFIVIDFKNSIYDEEDNREQLKNYVSLVCEIYPAKEAYAYIVDIDKNLLVKVC
jgi:ATP-dependent exoDNAse (exonuclease V) beta subunit